MRSNCHRNTPVTRIIGVIIAVLGPGPALAQLVPPEPLEVPQPAPQTGLGGMPMEGWAVVRFSIGIDGSTTSVRVVDMMPEQLVEREIRDAVEDWTFEPATSDGTAVEWHNNESVIVFDPETVPPEPRPMFVEGFREIEMLVEEEEYEDALRRSRRLVASESFRLAEIGVALVQHARVHALLGNRHEAIAAIRRATYPGVSLLEDSDLAVALEYRNRLELAVGDVVGALDTYARRQELGPVADNDPMASRVGAIESGLDSDAAIAVQGKIIDDTWSHRMTRRTFAIGDLEGGLNRVDVECNRGTAELEYSDTSEWSLPESWGECTVFVTGRRQTEFVLYEFR